jgi:hypothetical protein
MGEWRITYLVVWFYKLFFLPTFSFCPNLYWYRYNKYFIKTDVVDMLWTEYCLAVLSPQYYLKSQTKLKSPAPSESVVLARRAIKSS